MLTGETALALLHRITGDQDWLAEQAERLRTSRIFVAVPMFLAAARR